MMTVSSGTFIYSTLHYHLGLLSGLMLDSHCSYPRTFQYVQSSDGYRNILYRFGSEAA